MLHAVAGDEQATFTREQQGRFGGVGLRDAEQPETWDRQRVVFLKRLRGGAIEREYGLGARPLDMLIRWFVRVDALGIPLEQERLALEVKVWRDNVSVIAGVNNLFNANYYTRIRADGIDPSAPTNWYAGVKIEF